MSVSKLFLRVVPDPLPAPGAGQDGDAAPSDPVILVAEAFRQYAPLVASLGLRMTGMSADVDDFVQEVFLRATRGIAQLRHPAAAKSWLMSITINVARQRLRRRKLRRLVGLDRSNDHEQIVDPRLSPEERMLVTRVYGVLDGLPVNQRLAWTLRNVEGERLEAVAMLCGCSLSTAKRRIAAAQTAIQEVVG